MASSSAQICTSSTQLQRTCDEGLILRCTRLPWWRMGDGASLEKSDMSDHQLAHCTVPLLQRLEPKLTFQEVAKLRTEPLTLPEWRTGGRAGSRITSRDICRTTPLMQPWISSQTRRNRQWNCPMTQGGSDERRGREATSAARRRGCLRARTHRW